MKIYCNNLKVIKKGRIEQYFIKKKAIELVYSMRGLYQILKNEIVRLKIIDKPIEKIKIKEYDCVLDRSNYNVDDKVNQIPMEHSLVKINKLIYKLTPGSLLEFIIEEHENKIKDFYFNTKEELNTLELKDEIYTFLSLINNQNI